MSAPLTLEHNLIANGHTLIAGIDEAGRGAWAGPVVASAVILPVQDNTLAAQLAGVTDSKKLSAKKRDVLFDVIQTVATSIGVGIIPAAQIDQLGILNATKVAMATAVEQLDPMPDHLLIDAVNLRQHLNISQDYFNFGDSRSLSIAAASIIAKVTRDRMLIDLETEFAGYGFAKHKGYGTKQHQAALNDLGPCREHRFSYRPVALCNQAQLFEDTK